MRVTREIVTILVDAVAGEVNVVFPGFRITLTAEETAQLASGLANAAERLRGATTADPPSASQPAGDHAAALATSRDDTVRPFVSPTAAETELVQQRVRALIQASIKDKGLSLREEHRA